MRPGTTDNSLGTQFWYQLEGVLVSLGYSAAVTLILLVIVEKTVGFRLKESGEKAGMDYSLHGEHGYGMNNLNS